MLPNLDERIKLVVGIVDSHHKTRNTLEYSALEVITLDEAERTLEENSKQRDFFVGTFDNLVARIRVHLGNFGIH